MEYRIIADSSCDLTAELKEEWGVTTVPFEMTLGRKQFTDDDSLDLPAFMKEMAACTERIGSSAPPPYLFKKAFEGTHTSFAVTLSGKLSACYQNAMIGKKMAEEEAKADVHVFDSLSASAGEVLVAQKIHQLIKAGMEKSVIIANISRFIQDMRTYFILENINNLLKNGRLGKITGLLITKLGIKPIMCADEHGNIALFAKARGYKQSLEKMADTIRSSGKATENESLVITHCNNLPAAQLLAELIRNRYNFREILILSTKGLSSVYTDDKGIVMAF
ncbi:MAG: DegV family protein [Oscillospiraceae bacterium]|jgi:DegV family protein with EDD domain|nr:DegV family protein [Oscillospiraceae bacterium]